MFADNLRLCQRGVVSEERASEYHKRITEPKPIALHKVFGMQAGYDERRTCHIRIPKDIMLPNRDVKDRVHRRVITGADVVHRVVDNSLRAVYWMPQALVEDAVTPRRHTKLPQRRTRGVWSDPYPARSGKWE